MQNVKPLTIETQVTHSPAPWDRRAMPYINDARGQVVARVDYGNKDGNSALIAAAPELLAVCIDALRATSVETGGHDECQYCSEERGHDHAPWCWVPGALAAVGKAEGRDA